MSSSEGESIEKLARVVCRAISAGPIGFAIVGFDGLCLAVNATLASWAVPPRDASSFAAQICSYPGALGTRLQRAFESAREGEIVSLDVDRAPLLDRPGRFRLHVAPFTHEGAVRALSVTFEDLTENALAAEAFEASERRFRTLVDGSSDGIAVHRHGVVLYVNPAGVRMLGYDSGDQIVGAKLLDFVHPDHQRDVMERIAELERVGRVCAREERFVRRDGSELVVEASGSRVPLDDELANFVFFRDVTEQKQLEAERNGTSRMESLGRLAGSVAHDFNNLLGIIQGSLSIARLRLDDRRSLEESLEAAEAAAARAADMTRQLLTFSRGGEARPTLTEPTRVIEEAVSLVSGMSGQLDVRFEADAQVGQVWMGPSQLHQIVLNLLLNARDAVAEGGRVKVALERRCLDAVRPPLRPGDWLVITVSDTGCGMDAPTRARIFEPFFTTKPAGRGTGLGLSTVYGIVRQANGFIEVDSVRGRGTDFWVYLPVAPSNVKPSGQSSSRDGSAAL